MRTPLLIAAAALVAAPFASTVRAQGTFANFESPQVHPAAITPDGTKLLVTNTADARLTVFDLSQPSNPTILKEIPVGLEPVSVRARTNDEAWVVNHTSDSVSVVSISLGIVTDTLDAKDEPSDVVFAGTPLRAYVSLGRSDEVRVFDVSTHAPVATIPVFGEHPRALATSPDGSKVYAAFALSGNRTTLVPAPLAPPQPPPTNPLLPAPPQVGLIVDATDPAWTSVVKFTMPDNDVAEIATATNTVSRYFTRVGTHNTGIAVRPTNGDLYVANTDARNLVRFEPVLRAHTVDNQVSKIEIGTGAVTKYDLNPGVNYAVLPNLAALASALASPEEAVFDATGSALYVAAFGTDRVAKLDANGNVLARIEIGPATGTSVDPRTKRGPRGLALHPTNQRLYVVNRISNTVSVIHTATDAVVNEVPAGSFDPTPAAIRQGRGFLYDAKLSGNGTNSCASCHYDGDIDLLAWDLGDPSGSVQSVQGSAGPLGTFTFNMHPMKGPMTTQTLKGFNAGQSPLHWRGDRADFTAFNPAFDKLMGGSQLSTADMAAYKAFVETMRMEPNPNQNLDRSLPASVPGFAGNPQTGQSTFMTNQYQPFLTCNTCHTATLGGQSAFIIPAAALQESQDFNVPGLRNMYQKSRLVKAPGQPSRMGFGFVHDGAAGTLFEFLSQPVFGNVTNDSAKKNNLEAFMQCFDTGTAPAVGFSRTVAQANANNAPVAADVTLLQSQAAAGNCEAIAKGILDGQLRGLLYQPAQGNWRTDKTGVGPFAWAQLQAKATAGAATLTFLGVPPGTGARMGVDRDGDGVLDGDEVPLGPVASYGSSTPPCAGGLAMGVNSLPFAGNSVFALTCTNTVPGSLSLGLVASDPDLGGTPLFGFNLHVGMASLEVYGIDMVSDPSGFAVGPAPIGNIPALIGVTYAAQTIALAPCGANGLAASQGLLITIVSPF